MSMFNGNLLGERIRLLRGKKSQDVFAAELGISRGALSFYENGERKPDAEIIYKICDYCNVSSDYLLGFTDNETTDKDITFICDYTGLNEYSVGQLHSAYREYHHYVNIGSDYHISYYSEYNKLLNRIINKCDLETIIFSLLDLKEYSEEYMNLSDEERNINEKEIKNAFLSPAIIYKYQCDNARYQLVRTVENLADHFDQRKQVNGDGNDNSENE